MTSQDDRDPAAPYPNGPAAPETSSGSVWAGRILRALLVLAILGAAGGVSAYWLMNPPKAKRRPAKPQAILVEVQQVHPREEQVVIRAMGAVVPVRSIELGSRVRGEIVQVSPNFIPGGRFNAGDLLVKVDPNDFELSVRLQQAQVNKAAADVERAVSAITQQEADLTKAESALAIEMGQQSTALGEYKLLGETVKPEDEALVLREPQLKEAKANCAAAEAAKQAVIAARDAAKASEAANKVTLEQVQLDLKRTEIRAPFNAMVRSRNVNLGTQVAVGASLASLVGTDKYWVEVSVPVDELKRIRIPDFNSETGSAARVYHTGAWGPDASRPGAVTRLMSEIEPEGRMARLLVAVEDPLDLKAPPQERRPLILGSYVHIEIVGQKLANVVRVQRTAMRDGNHVWVMGPDDKLEIRQVRIAWAGNDHVCVAEGLTAGDRLIVSDLGAPVEGMPLRTAESVKEEPGQIAETGREAGRQETQP